MNLSSLKFRYCFFISLLYNMSLEKFFNIATLYFAMAPKSARNSGSQSCGENYDGLAQQHTHKRRSTMAQEPIGADAARLAGLQIDMLGKYRAGQLSLDHLDHFVNLTPEGREDRFGMRVVRPAVAVDETVAPVDGVYLRRIFNTEMITVGATRGVLWETLSRSNLFAGGMYGFPRPFRKARELTQTFVYNLVADGTLAQAFRSLGENRKRWTEAQVIRFCQDHRYKFMGGKGVTSHFELEVGSVIGVTVESDNHLTEATCGFSNESVLRVKDKHHFVIPVPVR